MAFEKKPRVHGSGRIKKTPENMKKFLDALANNNAFPSYGCQAAGINHSTAYRWRDEDPEFKEAWDEVVKHHLDSVENALVGRAVVGEKKEIYYQGQVVGHEMVKSDRLGEWYVNNRRGYQTKVDHRLGGLPGAPPILTTEVMFDPSRLTDDEQQQLLALIAKSRPPVPDGESNIQVSG